MKERIEKQEIEEMAKIAFPFLDVVKPEFYNMAIHGNPHVIKPIENLYNAGYHRQIVGEWTRIEVKGKNYAQVYYQHKDCEVNETQMFPSPYEYCPNCGAKMKG